jgi:hypothetical protein
MKLDSRAITLVDVSDGKTLSRRSYLYEITFLHMRSIYQNIGQTFARVFMIFQVCVHLQTLTIKQKYYLYILIQIVAP